LEYFIALSASAPLTALERTLQQACPDVEVRPLGSSELREAFPESENVVSVALRATAHAAGPSRSYTGLVSHRHTPTAALRRLVLHTACAFGGVRLFVRPNAGKLRHAPTRPARRQTTTLAGFLRSGRVVQDGTLLDIRSSD
jgi:hypothetical protein